MKCLAFHFNSSLLTHYRQESECCQFVAVKLTAATEDLENTACRHPTLSSLRPAAEPVSGSAVDSFKYLYLHDLHLRKTSGSRRFFQKYTKIL